jgi:hypothetical protein
MGKMFSKRIGFWPLHLREQAGNAHVYMGRQGKANTHERDTHAHASTHARGHTHTQLLQNKRIHSNSNNSFQKALEDKIMGNGNSRPVLGTTMLFNWQHSGLSEPSHSHCGFPPPAAVIESGFGEWGCQPEP